jgi:predicted helicase
MDREETINSVKLVQNYIHSIERKLATGDATEHTHRSALEALVESLAEGITATNEPRHIECGAPDFILRKGPVAVGYIEAKDIGKSLDEVEKSEQLNRYRDSLTNLILTDYLEFRWYVDGKKRLSARLGTPTKDGKIRRDKEGMPEVAELLTNFLSHKAEGVGTPKELAQRMAKQAHLIRNLIINAFKNEPEGGSLHTQLAAFRDNLIPDLSVEYFADMYAQTIIYGLFAARCTHPEEKSFTRQNAAYLLPKTNPFLRKLFNTIAGPELDDRIAWLVDDLAQVLAQADMEAVLRDFGKHSGKEDPVVHFYETFLTAYDSKVREMRGVYYTPEPVVSYIVRSIDHLLKTCFNKPQGLADGKTLILDPAVGTATFLYMVVNEIRQSMLSHGQQGSWNNYVAEKLLPRIFGFELLMAPYAVAHLKLGLLLKETEYQFKSDQRLGIYLTNTLEEAIKHSETLFAQWITEEANAAARIKKDEPIMVVLGNPPYSGISANASIRTVIDPKSGKPKQELTWVGRLIEDYKVVDGQPLNERKHWLQDDYVKFIRFGQWRIKETSRGILGFITNHAYLDNPTFRGMRQSLLNTFTDIYILNLHGNVKKKETTPDGGKDENVFDIQQGVAIGIFVKEAEKKSPARVHYADLWGLREEKYQALFDTEVNDTVWKELTPTSPFYFFVPREEELRPEYEREWKITEIFPVNSTGIVTARDGFVIDFDSAPIRRRIEIFLDKNLSDAEVKEKLSLSENYAWRVSEARKQLMAVKDWESLFSRILYRPFDVRSIYFHPSVVWRTRSNVMRHMLAGENLGLIAMREVALGESYSHFGVSRLMVDNRAFYSNKGIQYLFPLYLYPAEGEMQFDGGKRRPNLNPEFIKAVQEKLGLKFVEDGRGDLKETFGPEDIFNYAYAVFHSPTYRSRYAEFLKIDFPRLPLTSDKKLFKALAEKGAELVALHLMESPALDEPITRYPVTGSNEVEKIGYDDKNQRAYINKTQYFEGVPPEVWEFHIGGYQVAQKWLKDRKGRSLSYDEQSHYQRIIIALKETIRIMAEIDSLIPGWPVE